MPLPTGQIQRRLAWPLHKDDILTRISRPHFFDYWRFKRLKFKIFGAFNASSARALRRVCGLVVAEKAVPERPFLLGHRSMSLAMSPQDSSSLIGPVPAVQERRPVGAEAGSCASDHGRVTI